MLTNKYKAYYNYLAKNWTKKLAAHILKHEVVGEENYGIDTTGTDLLKKLEKAGIDIERASIYSPAPYDILEEVFEKINISTSKHFLDIGCGKGRALVVAGYMGAKKVSGVDFSKALCDAATENLNSLKSKNRKVKATVYHNDAFHFPIEKDVDVIFLFNPFDKITMSGVLSNIEASLAKNKRKITIVYINPVEKNMLLWYDYVEIEHVKKMRYLAYSILVKQ